MEIGLRKEHLEKGCSIIENKHYVYYETTIHLTKHEHSLWYENENLCRDKCIDDTDNPFYRDFLQLIIERINDIRPDGFYIEQLSGRIIACEPVLTCSRQTVANFKFRDYTAIEAKEKVIEWFFDNTEVAKN